jgi:nucleoside 2-deoxyribosyltransferase
MKTVVLCGSMKFKTEMEAFSQQLKKAGVVVYTPHFEADHKEWDSISKEYQQYVAMGLTFDHLNKIRMADVVFIYNKDGYSGVGVTLEIGYAVALNKPIYALAQDEEICRQVLFREIILSAEELIKMLI